MFQQLRTNNQLYILHKEEKPYVETGTVVSVSAPKPKYPMGQPLGGLPQLEMIVDVVANVGGQNTNLQGLPANQDIADCGQGGNVVVSCSREAMNSEIASMKQKSIDILGSVNYHKSVIHGCDEILTALNPEFAAKQAQDKEISDLKAQVSEMSKNMSELVEMNKRLMKQFDEDSETLKTKK